LFFLREIVASATGSLNLCARYFLLSSVFSPLSNSFLHHSHSLSTTTGDYYNPTSKYHSTASRTSLVVSKLGSPSPTSRNSSSKYDIYSRSKNIYPPAHVSSHLTSIHFQKLIFIPLVYAAMKH